MPRKPRLDAPGLLYHVMARGIEKRDIFLDDLDREQFLGRLGKVATDTGIVVYAFSLMPNHFHLLLRRVNKSIATAMRKLLTGYAIYFNKKYERVGYVFQNRYKATVCQEDTYFLELVRYINLNPERAGIVSGLTMLDSYLYTSHSLLVGKRQREFFDPDVVLGHFGNTEKQSRNRYREFIKDGLGMGRRPELTGGGLKRSLGFPSVYPKQKQAYDDRILGDGAFVESILVEAHDGRGGPPIELSGEAILSEVVHAHNVRESEILGSSRNRSVCNARAAYAYRLAKEAGASASEIARRLGVSRPSAWKMIVREETRQK